MHYSFINQLPLRYPCSLMNNQYNLALKYIGKKMVVSYLADQPLRNNPFEIHDDVGVFYDTADPSNDHIADQLLGFESDSTADVDFVSFSTHEFEAYLKPEWVRLAVLSDSFKEWSRVTSAGMDTPFSDTESYYAYRAIALWDETEGLPKTSTFSIYSFELHDELLMNVWHMLIADGLIGDKDLLLIRSYRGRGLTKHTLYKEGEICRQDTTDDYSIWVPNDKTRLLIDELAPYFTFGRIYSEEVNQSWDDDNKIIVVNDTFCPEGSLSRGHYGSMKDAMESFKRKGDEYLKTKRGQVAAQKNHKLGRRAAARFIAKEAFEKYNKCLRNETFSAVTSVFENIGTEEKPVWDHLKSEISSERLVIYLAIDKRVEMQCDEVKAQKAMLEQ